MPVSLCSNMFHFASTDSFFITSKQLANSCSSFFVRLVSPLFLTYMIKIDDGNFSPLYCFIYAICESSFSKRSVRIYPGVRIKRALRKNVMDKCLIDLKNKAAIFTWKR